MTVCVYCGQADGHSPRCSVTKFGVEDVRWDGGDESRVQALMAENERLRLALIATRFYAKAPHTRMGEACGVGACVGCLIEATALAALRGEEVVA